MPFLSDYKANEPSNVRTFNIFFRPFGHIHVDKFQYITIHLVNIKVYFTMSHSNNACGAKPFPHANIYQIVNLKDDELLNITIFMVVV